MKGRRETYAVDVGGKRGQAVFPAAGDLPVKEVRKRRFMRASGVIKTAWGR